MSGILRWYTYMEKYWVIEKLNYLQTKIAESMSSHTKTIPKKNNFSVTFCCIFPKLIYKTLKCFPSKLAYYKRQIPSHLQRS